MAPEPNRKIFMWPELKGITEEVVEQTEKMQERCTGQKAGEISEKQRYLPCLLRTSSVLLS